MLVLRSSSEQYFLCLYKADNLQVYISCKFGPLYYSQFLSLDLCKYFSEISPSHPPLWVVECSFSPCSSLKAFVTYGSQARTSSSAPSCPPEQPLSKGTTGFPHLAHILAAFLAALSHPYQSQQPLEPLSSTCQYGSLMSHLSSEHYRSS